MSTWIFLRGLTRERRHWGDFPELFQQRVPEACVLTPDLPGNGRLNDQPSPTRIDGMTEAIRARLRAEGIRPPYYLLAMSLGAMVATDWTQRYPKELAGAVLINTSLRPFAAFFQRLRPINYPRLFRLLLPGLDELERERIVFELTTRHPPHPEATLERWRAYRRDRPVSARNALRQLLAAARYGAPPNAPDVPLLILNGAADRLVAPLCSRRLAEAWHTDYAQHPSAGHDLPLDAGDWVAQQVAQWLDRGAARLARQPRGPWSR